jgi:hypothetical protein
MVEYLMLNKILDHFVCHPVHDLSLTPTAYTKAQQLTSKAKIQCVSIITNE